MQISFRKPDTYPQTITDQDGRVVLPPCLFSQLAIVLGGQEESGLRTISSLHITSCYPLAKTLGHRRAWWSERMT